MRSAIAIQARTTDTPRSGAEADDPPTETRPVLPAISQHQPTPSPGPTPEPPPAAMFGSTLEPILREQLDGRLSPVSWFRTDWQRGGALTGTATYIDDQTGSRASPQDVVVKLPVPPRERRWLKRCNDAHLGQPQPGVTPHLYAHGESLNGYDLAWAVMEKLPYGPLGAKWGPAAFDLLLDAAAEFQHTAQRTPPQDDAHAQRNRLTNDWAKLFDKARAQVKAKTFPQGQAWKKQLKQHAKHFDALLDQWAKRPTTGWCHGDLHLGNAMSRSPQDTGHSNQTQGQDQTKGQPAQIVLIDFACVHPGHWVEDAVYCEQLYWAFPDQLQGRKLASQLAKARRARGLDVDDDWAQWADLLRNLYALTAPATVGHHGGGAAFLDAALKRIA